MIYNGINRKAAICRTMIDHVFKINTVTFLYFGSDSG